MHNILYVSHTGQIGGAENSLLLLLERLDRSRFAPAVALPEPGPLAEELRERNVPFHFAPIRPIRRTSNPITLCRYFLEWRRAISEIVHLIRERRIDLVHSNSTTAHLFGAAAARRCGIPSIWHVRDASSPGGWIDRMITRNAAAIIAISESVKAGLAHPELARQKTKVVHNGVDTARFAPATSSLRHELKIADAAPLAGILGQIVPWKRHDLFLQAAALVLQRLPNARFVVAGDNRFNDFPALLDQLKRQAEQLGLADRVLFLGWRKDTANVLNALDVFVLTSENEPFGRVVIEAMACGKPVVAFRCGGPVEIIEPGQTGVLVDPLDVPQLADAMIRLMSDPASARGMGEAARQVACEKFSADAYAGRVQTVYAEALSASLFPTCSGVGLSQ